MFDIFLINIHYLSYMRALFMLTWTIKFYNNASFLRDSFMFQHFFSLYNFRSLTCDFFWSKCSSHRIKTEKCSCKKTLKWYKLQLTLKLLVSVSLSKRSIKSNHIKNDWVRNGISSLLLLLLWFICERILFGSLITITKEIVSKKGC